MDKSFTNSYNLIENMTQSHYQWGNKRIHIKKSQTKGGMYDVKGLDHVNVMVDALTQKTENLTITPAAIVAVVNPLCDICIVQGHITFDYQFIF